MISSVPSLTNTHAAAHKLVLDTLFPGRTWQTWSTNVWGLRLLTSTAVGIARGTAGTLAGESSGFVVADRARGTRVNGTLVDVPAATLHSRLSCVTVATETGGDVVREHAVGVGSAG